MKPLLALSLLAAWILAGCGNPAALNERHADYRRGLELRKSGQYEQAARAFRHCLRQSPRSWKAHAQLATLCEDYLDDLPGAIGHYRRAAELCPDPQRQQGYRQARELAERRLLAVLRERYPDATTAAGPPPGETTAQEPGEGPASAAPLANAGGQRSTTATAQPPPERPLAREHVVKDGDTLGKLARHYYGQATDWPRIYEANRDRLPSPERLQIGQTLRIPPPPEATSKP